MILVRNDSSNSSFTPSDGLLTAADLPGYSLTRQDDKSTPVNGQTTPATCVDVIAAQDRLVERQSSVAVVAQSASDDLPTITQSVLTGGPSVAQTRDTVSRCPQYAKSAGAESVTIATTVLRPPSQCPSDALVVRMRTQLNTAQLQSDSSSIVGYVQGRSAVGVLTEVLRSPTQDVPDRFCSLLTTIQNRIGEK
ncbi:hypothetical protein ASG12_07780 [Williamsia sp. Leaf354]|nr:hypothetical protein ASG12_07780 [Williamsia sp. Leaf354]